MKFPALLLLCLTLLSSGNTENQTSPVSLLERRQPNHPALALNLHTKSPFQAHQAITAPDFLATLTPAQKKPLTQLRDVFAANLRVAGHPNFHPPTDYQIQNHLGWSIFLHKDLVGEKSKRALQLLDQQLQAIIDRVPAPAVAYLKKVPLYFTPSPDARGGACHHPSSTWLANNNKPVEMAKSVEFTNVENFEHETRRMPNFVLHELAHAYHNHLLGDDHPAILSAFQAAKKSGTYKNLPKRSGDPKKPYRIDKGETYAMSNQMEYFAEATEAYFHANDYYPHRRSQLIEHDPKVVAVLEKVWGVKKPKHPVLTANRILFLGDSITAGRDYIIKLQAALHLKGHTPEVIASGLGSEGVTGLTEPTHPFPRPDVTERLDRTLAKVKPDLVIACYGMNDGIYHPYSHARFTAYQTGIQSLIEKVKASGAKLILITPPPFDPKAPEAAKNLVGPDAPLFTWKNIYQNYDAEVIARYAKYILSLKPQVTTVIDIHTPLNQHLSETRKTKTDYKLSNDGVHLSPEGHRIMASAIHQSLFTKPLPKLPADLPKFYKTRQSFLSPAWLTHTGHTRPGIKPGLPLKEAQARAAFTIR